MSIVNITVNTSLSHLTEMKSLRLIIIVAALLGICAPMRAEKLAMHNPIVLGNNRITLITPTLFRLESTTDGKFIDNRTMLAYDRTQLLADSLYTVEKLDDEKYRITTPAIRIEYIHRGESFSSANLVAYFKYNGKEKHFTIRQIAHGNLGGPIETLDRVAKEVPATPVSRKVTVEYKMAEKI